MALLVEDDKVCDLLVWFHRPESCSEIKFTQFYGIYIRTFEKPKETHNYETVCVPEISRPIYLKKRSTEVLTRMQMIYINVGEMFYLRTLLLYVCAASFEELKSYDGQQFETFQESAYARNIVDDKNECLKCMEENLIFSTPHELRSLFIVMTSQGFATLPILANAHIMLGMTTDYRIRLHTGEIVTEQVTNLLLKEFQQSLAIQGKTMEQFGLPTPDEESETELDVETRRYCNEEQQRVYDALNAQYPNNDEQQMVMDRVVHALNEPGSTMFIFVQGLAGTGKSNLDNLINLNSYYLLLLHELFTLNKKYNNRLICREKNSFVWTGKWIFIVCSGKHGSRGHTL
jgi:hypothetical protein